VSEESAHQGIPPTPPDTTGSAGPVYATLVENQLGEETARKTSFEARGITVITTSAALVGLLFGFSALVAGADTFTLPPAAVVFLSTSATLFVVAAILSIVCNWPLKYRQVELADLRRLTNEQFWWGEEAVAKRRVAEARVEILSRARELNAIKGRFLLAAMMIEVIAIGALAVGVIIIITS
jgi:hypothetical protein